MPQDAIQALDVALKHAAMMSANLVAIARAFFNPATARTLGAGAEVRRRRTTPAIITAMPRHTQAVVADSTQQPYQMSGRGFLVIAWVLSKWSAPNFACSMPDA